MTKALKTPLSPAVRLRLYRQGRRLRRHAFHAEINIDDAKIEGLIKRGYLQPSERDDASAIEQAANLFFWDSIGGSSGDDMKSAS